MSKIPVGSTFCILPWTHRFTNIGGEVQICCSSEERENNIRSADGDILKAENLSSPEEALNSPTLRSLRLKMLSGEWPEACERCRLTEMMGGPSRRTTENARYAAEINDLISRTQLDGTISNPKIFSIDLRLGNTCNLACRMCNPRSSSKWQRDWGQLDHDDTFFTPLEMNKWRGINWYKNPNIKRELEKCLPSLRQLHFAGGEPLIVPEMLEFLRQCVASGHSQQIEVSYNTNLTVLPPEAKSLWPKFKAVKLLCSIDGIGEVNELIRFPSKWSVIDANLRTLDRSLAEWGITQVLVMCTVQIYNIYRLAELFDYLAINFKNINQIPHLVDLHHPMYYRTQQLTPAEKNFALEKLRALLDVTEERIRAGMIPKHQRYHLETLRASIAFMQEPAPEDRRNELGRVIKSIDAFRRQNTFQVLPELNRMLSPSL